MDAESPFLRRPTAPAGSPANVSHHHSVVEISPGERAVRIRHWFTDGTRMHDAKMEIWPLTLRRIAELRVYLDEAERQILLEDREA